MYPPRVHDAWMLLFWYLRQDSRIEEELYSKYPAKIAGEVSQIPGQDAS